MSELAELLERQAAEAEEMTDAELTECNECQGRGEVTVWCWNAEPDYEPCDKCRGTGLASPYRELI
jgi:DnaJ-class molecular chaperone